MVRLSVAAVALSLATVVYASIRVPTCLPNDAPVICEYDPKKIGQAFAFGRYIPTQFCNAVAYHAYTYTGNPKDPLRLHPANKDSIEDLLMWRDINAPHLKVLMVVRLDFYQNSTYKQFTFPIDDTQTKLAFENMADFITFRRADGVILSIENYDQLHPHSAAAKNVATWHGHFYMNVMNLGFTVLTRWLRPRNIDTYWTIVGKNFATVDRYLRPSGAFQFGLPHFIHMTQYDTNVRTTGSSAAISMYQTIMKGAVNRSTKWGAWGDIDYADYKKNTISEASYQRFTLMGIDIGNTPYGTCNSNNIFSIMRTAQPSSACGNVAAIGEVLAALPKLRGFYVSGIPDQVDCSDSQSPMRQASEGFGWQISKLVTRNEVTRLTMDIGVDINSANSISCSFFEDRQIFVS